MKRPMFLFGFIAIVMTLSCFYHRKLSLILTVLTVISILIIVFLDKKDYILPAVLCFFIMLNMLSVNARNDRIALASKSVIHGKFVATEDMVHMDEYSSVKLKCLSADALPEGYNLSLLYYGEENIVAGDIVNLSVKLREPYKKDKEILYGEDIYFSGYIKEVNFRDGTDAVYSALGKIRRYIIRSDRKYLKGDTAGTLIAITVGDKSYLSDELLSDVKTVGGSHMMAVSGFHLAILLGSIFTFINRFFKNKYLRFLFSFTSVIILIGVCGFTKSIIRAGLMYIIASAAPLFGRENDSLNSLGTAILLMLLVSPFAANSLAFKLSVMSTFAIIYVSQYFLGVLCSKLKITSKIIKSILGIIFDTFFATLFTMPVAIKYFGSVSTVGIPVNLALNLLVTAALIFNALALIIPVFFGLLREILFRMAGVFSKMSNVIISYFAKLPGASKELGERAFFISSFIIVITVILIDTLKYIKKRKGRSNADVSGV